MAKDVGDLAGSLALVTGASRGIGRAIAGRLAQAGCGLALLARHSRPLDEAAAALRETGARVFTYPYDLADVAGIGAMYQRVCEEAGVCDILANNAGLNLRGDALAISLDTWRSVMQVNVDAVFALSQAFARALVSAGKPGCIVNIGSLMCEAARATTAPYTASKGAIRQLTKALAVEWARHGIRVNAVAPGYIETEMTEPLRNDAAMNAWVISRTPLGRWGTPEEVAETVAFLASPAAAFVNGHVLYVDGGFMASL